MFDLFGNKDKKAALEKQYQLLMQEARDIQRKGDMKAFALKTAEAEKIMDELVTLKQNNP